MGKKRGFKHVDLVWFFFMCELELMSGQIWLLWTTSFIDATLQLNVHCTKSIENLKLHTFKLWGFPPNFFKYWRQLF